MQHSEERINEHDRQLRSKTENLVLEPLVHNSLIMSKKYTTCMGDFQAGYLAVWKIQEKMVADFAKRGVDVPERIINDLKLAKTLIKILEADSSQCGTVQQLEGYLANVESYLVSEGEKQFGSTYADEWLRLLNEASRKTVEEDNEPKSVPGLPRGHKWIRIESSPELSLEKLKVLAEDAHLSYKIQDDGYFLVYGKDEHVKDFVKRMASKYRSQTGKHR